MPDHPVPHPDVAGYVLGVLDAEESRHFAGHVLDCPDCQREVAELASLRVVLDRGMAAPVLPTGLAERTFAAIETAASAEATAAPSPALESPAAVAPLLPARRRWSRVPATAVAALAGVAAVVAGLFLMTRSTANVREVALVAPGGGSGEGVARLQRGDAGVIVELAVVGLPVPPEGSFYECWYVADTDTADHPNRVTAGTFTVAAKGTTKVHMTTAADHEHFPRIEVTLEPDDGDPSRTGPVVLRSPSRP